MYLSVDTDAKHAEAEAAAERSEARIRLPALPACRHPGSQPHLVAYSRSSYFDSPSASYITKEVKVEDGEDSTPDVDNNAAWDAAEGTGQEHRELQEDEGRTGSVVRHDRDGADAGR